MNQADTELLAKFLEGSARPDGTLRFHELQGFLFAITGCPETIAPSEAEDRDAIEPPTLEFSVESKNAFNQEFP